MLKSYLVEKITSGQNPEVKKKGCLNQRKGQLGCMLCVDLCPSNAISYKGKVIIDEASCDGCSLCTARCPSQALRSKNINYREILSKANEKKSLLLACRDSQVKGESITVPCLASLHWEFIAALFRINKNKEIMFYLANCSTCFRGKSIWVLYKSLKKAGAVLQGLDQLIDIKYVFEEDFFIEESSPEISRREVFSIFKSALLKSVDRVVDDVINESKETEISEQRQCLNNAINGEKSFYFEEGDLPFGNWTIGDECNGCGFCQGICPQGAWKIAEKNKCFILTHSPWKCVFCKLCLSLCPQKTIKSVPWKEIPPIEKVITKKIIPLKLCSRCSSPIPELNKDELCNSCRKKENLKKSLK